MSENANVPLADLIGALRQELNKAISEGTDEHLQFELGPVELELQVEVSRAAKGTAGVQFWVLALGASGSRTATHAHTVRLTLNPLAAPDGRSVRVRSHEPKRPS